MSLEINNRTFTGEETRIYKNSIEKLLQNMKDLESKNELLQNKINGLHSDIKDVDEIKDKMEQFILRFSYFKKDLNNIKKHLNLQIKKTVNKECQTEGRKYTSLEMSTQTDKIQLLPTKEKIAKQLNNKIEPKLNEPKLDIFSLTILHDKRIALGGMKAISICSFVQEFKKLEQKLLNERAHESWITSLCQPEQNDNILISSSLDNTIKIWDISSELSLKQVITSHLKWVLNVIPIPDNRFVSCSRDKTIKIWKSREPYEELKNIANNGWIYAVMYLKKKALLVSSSDERKIAFWDSNTYESKYVLDGYFTMSCNHMMELPDGNLVISSKTKYNPIVIIDTTQFKVIKEIMLTDFINHESSLCLINDNAFFYIYNGKYLKLSTNDFSIMTQNSNYHGIDGYRGIELINGGEYFIAAGCKGVVSIVECY